MDPVLDEFEAIAQSLTYNTPRIPIVSTLTGDLTADLTDPTYWTRQLRNTVRFHDALTTLATQGVTTYLELGPDTTLTTLTRTTHPNTAAAALLAPKRPETETALTALATAHTHGHTTTWPTHGAYLPLPTYPFQHQTYWLEPRPAGGTGGVDGLLWEAVAERDEEALAGLLALDAEQRKALSAVLPALAGWFEARTATAGPSVLEAYAEDAEAETPLPLLRERVAGASAEEAGRLLLEAVRRHTADVLGLATSDEVDPQLEFLELGLSSFTAMELSKRLGEDGLELDPTAIYDHPTPGELADHLRTTL
jgi:acyl transferase domain-containing protein/aryl carrier-like protein